MAKGTLHASTLEITAKLPIFGDCIRNSVFSQLKQLIHDIKNLSRPTVYKLSRPSPMILAVLRVSDDVELYPLLCKDFSYKAHLAVLFPLYSFRNPPPTWNYCDNPWNICNWGFLLRSFTRLEAAISKASPRRSRQVLKMGTFAVNSSMVQSFCPAVSFLEIPCEARLSCSRIRCVGWKPTKHGIVHSRLL